MNGYLYGRPTERNSTDQANQLGYRLRAWSTCVLESDWCARISHWCEGIVQRGRRRWSCESCVQHWRHVWRVHEGPQVDRLAGTRWNAEGGCQVLQQYDSADDWVVFAVQRRLQTQAAQDHQPRRSFSSDQKREFQLQNANRFSWFSELARRWLEMGTQRSRPPYKVLPPQSA